MAGGTDRIFQYRFLPDEIRAFFLDSGYDDIEAIAKQYGLSQTAIDTLDVLQQEVLFGYEPVDKLRNLIQQRLKFDEKMATRVALDVIEKRFLPIDSYLGATAYRTFAALGGNATVINIRRIDASGGTVVDVRRALTDFQVEERAKKTGERVEEAQQQQVAPGSEEKIIAELPVSKESEERSVKRTSDNASVSSKPDAVKQAVASKPSSPTSAVLATQAFDKALDRVDQGQKGEAKNDSGIVNAPLDPGHELAPPPPALVQQNKQPKKREKPVRPAVSAAPAKLEKGSVVKTAPSKRKLEQGAVPPPRQEGDSKVPPVTKTVRPPAQEKVVTAKAPTPILTSEIQEEAEVAHMMQQLEKAGERAPRGLEHTKIDEVRRKLSLTFPSAELDKRFRVLVGSRLSGVRSAEKFKAALERSIQTGGLALDTHTVERVLDAIEGHLEEEQTQARERHAQAREEHVRARQASYKVTASTIGAPAQEPVAQEAPARKTQVKLSPDSMKQRPLASGKKPIVDIRYQRRLVGPIEELKRMTLADFRRLPGDVSEVLESIREDIDGMEKRDPGLRIQAVEAWRSSPLVQTYRKLMSAALRKGVSMAEILKDAQENPGDMTLDELNAIRSFNSSLRY